MLSTAASIAASAVFARTMINDFLPEQLQHYIGSVTATILGHFSSKLTITIEEFDGLYVNHMYKAAEIYLGTKVSPSTRHLRITKQKDERSLEVTMGRGEEVIDVFQGVQFRWCLVSRESRRSLRHMRHQMNYMNPIEFPTEIRSYQLDFHRKYKNEALNSYLPWVVDQAKAIKEQNRILKIHNLEYGDTWTPVNLDHPATFETLALDPDLKKAVVEDLDRFVRRKDYYRRVGKAWKRGYLLYGPPGTGKSSLIAAMANYLKFDVYDLELTEITCNSDLRSLLVKTANKSILVIEDIDCTIKLQNREAEAEKKETEKEKEKPSSEKKVTLSGLLNFIDGLWSSCGDERIIVFTTNHKERLDPALIRPGRMDMHIHLGYCSPFAFRILASNYHGVADHPLYKEIEDLIKEVKVTPAEVAEELMKKDNVEIALRGLIQILQKKMEVINEAKTESEKNKWIRKLRKRWKNNKKE